ncbi:MAG: DUF3592 domain-containing protein [Bacteroidia bacterium]|nr:DUF3592 domain-containing protein [Bacteroidia bacterium]
MYIANPPRSVPPTTRLVVLFGGVLQQIGFLFLLFGIPFTFAFLPLRTVIGGLAGSPNRETTGTVTLAEPTGASENDVTVYKNTFTFTADDGKRYTGSSYTTGQGVEAGESVTVRYRSSDPTWAVIEGQRMGLFPVWVGFMILIFPAAGGLVAWLGLRNRPRALRLLANGHYATGKLVSKEPTNTRINNRTVMKLTFEVSLPSGRAFQATAQHHLPEKLEDEAEEPLLYLEDSLGGYQAQLLDELPGNIRFDTNGNITAAPVGQAIGAALLPVLCGVAVVVGLALALP